MEQHFVQHYVMRPCPARKYIDNLRFGKALTTLEQWQKTQLPFEPLQSPGGCVIIKKKFHLPILWNFQGIVNTELANYALDQVHCWGTYFRHKIGHFENFTPLNF